MEPSPGYKSTEAAAALVGIGGPLLTAIISRDLTWQQLVALGIVAFVACVYIGCRTWLKRAGVPVALALLLLASPALADGPQLRAPMPADVAAAPLVPPEAIVPPAACPEPCAACASRVGTALTPAGQPMPTWLKAVLGVGIALGGALTIYQQGHASGTW